MFGMNRRDVKAIAQHYHDRIGRRLFGAGGENCLNLYDGEGLLGEMSVKIDKLENAVYDLKAKVVELTPKPKKAKKVAKKTRK